MSFKITKIQKLRQNTADFSDDEPLAAVWAGGLIWLATWMSQS
jgi:hypothetical protein